MSKVFLCEGIGNGHIPRNSLVFRHRARAQLWRSLWAVRVNVAYLQGSQVRPPGQSSSVRTSHSSGEHTHERALATASDSTTMPPKRSNAALILPSSLSISTAAPSLILPVWSSLFSYFVSPRHQLRNGHEDVHCVQYISKPFHATTRSILDLSHAHDNRSSFSFSLSIYDKKLFIKRGGQSRDVVPGVAE